MVGLKCNSDCYCVTFNEDEIRAEVGLCAVIPCAFTSLFAPKHIIWYKCDTARCYYPEIIFHSDKNKENIQPGFKGRVSLVEPDVAQKNCSIIINDLKESDSGSYQLRVEGNSTKDPSVMIPPLTEGQLVTLTCTAPGLCSGSPPNITWMWRGKGENDSFIKGNITALKTENLTAFTQRHVSTLTFNSSADHHNTKITCKVSFTGNITTEETVTLNITGNQMIKEGDALNLTCSVDSVPPSLIMWSKNSLSMHPSNRTSSPNNTGSVLNGSECVLRSDVLTCVCLSEGFPLPTIQWPLLKGHTEYSITRVVSNHTVNSTVTITVENHGNISVECVSSNGNGEAKENLTVLWTKGEGTVNTCATFNFCFKVLIAIFFFFLVSVRTDGCMSNGQALAGAPEATNGPKELVYANIDFSLLNRIPTKRIRSSKNKNTEYAEIKTNKEKGHQVEMMIEEDGETKNCVQEVKEEAEEPVYAKVEEPVYAKVEDLVEES
uniref:Ig-like domain-containing protein n=1 Tax=Poecilia latipinna TaxID=48699 RepID=A0A3B3TYB0_9TELE